MSEPVFRAILFARGVPQPEAEYAFAKPRRWRFDWAWPDAKVALEVEGGVWTRGRHTRPRGFLGDVEKYNAAAVLGWRVVRVTPDQLCTLATVEMLEMLLSEEAGMTEREKREQDERLDAMQEAVDRLHEYIAAIRTPRTTVTAAGDIGWQPTGKE